MTHGWLAVVWFEGVTLHSSMARERKEVRKRWIGCSSGCIVAGLHIEVGGGLDSRPDSLSLSLPLHCNITCMGRNSRMLTCAPWPKKGRDGGGQVRTKGGWSDSRLAVPVGACALACGL